MLKLFFIRFAALILIIGLDIMVGWFAFIMFFVVVPLLFWWFTRNDDNHTLADNKKSLKSDKDLLIYSQVREPLNIVKEESIIKKEYQYDSAVEEQLARKFNRKTKIFWAGDNHRTHPWSLMPGGCTVVVMYKDGKCVGYDKVKRPDRYLMKVTCEYLCDIDSNVQVDTVGEYIDGIYAVADGETELEEVWTQYDTSSPWDLLEAYRVK